MQVKDVRVSRCFSVLPKFFASLLFVLGLIGLFPSQAIAQNGDPLSETGFKPFGSFDNGDFDSVNLVNLRLNLHIPLGPTYQQRGKMFPLGYHFIYEPNDIVEEHRYENCQDFSAGDPCDGDVDVLFGILSNGGLSIMEDNTLNSSGNTIFTADGAMHEADASVSAGGQLSLDASGLLDINPGLLNETVKNGAGVSVTYPSTSDAYLAYSDINATSNQVSFGSNGVTDTINRLLPNLRSLPNPNARFPSDFNGYSGPGWAVTTDYSGCTGRFPTVYAVNVTFPSGYGGTSSYKVCYADFYISLFYENINDVSYGGNLQPGYYQLPGQAIYPPVIQVQSIALPNATAYTFDYDGYTNSDEATQHGAAGDLTKVTLPTGGSIAYTWKSAAFPTGTGCPVLNTFHERRILTSRTINANVGASQTWHYQILADNSVPRNSSATFDYPNGAGSTADYPYLVLVTDPNGNDTVHNLTDVDSHDGSCTYYETATQYYSGSSPVNPSPSSANSTLLKTVVTHYSYTSWRLTSQYFGYLNSPHAINIVPDSVTTTYPDGSGLKKTFGYDSGYELLSADGTPTGIKAIVGNRTSETDEDLVTHRKITTTNNYKTDSASVNAWLVHLLSDSTVSDSGGNTAARTTYGYDGAGNLTSTTKSIDGNTSVTSGVGYNGSGMPTSTTDPMQNTTNITYDGTGLFVDHIQKPTTTNGVAHVEYFSYDSNTGNLNSHKDENGNTTSYDYHDPMGRLKQVQYPSTQAGATGAIGQGTVSLSYDDTALTLTSTTTATPDPSMTTVTTYDGLGRVTQTTAANGATTETAYTPLGQTYSVSNPHFAGSASVDKTTFEYDALGRKTKVTQQDSSTKQWSYDGSKTTYTDEANHSTVSYLDGFGRLTDIYEDAAGSNLHTQYGYDTLGNLTAVTQSGTSGDTPRTRSFGYDWLSRLTSSTNPETGTVGYTYDNSGNVLSKTDARAITTSYDYDSLNRPLRKRYSGTEVAHWTYDGTFPPGIPGQALSDPNPNQVGRLSYMWAAQPVGAGAEDQYFGYDAVGRLRHWAEASPSELGVTAHSWNAAFNLAGNINTLYYPDGLQITQSFDSGGHLSTISSGSMSYVSAASYFADGSPKAMTYGNGTTETLSQNNRMQTCESTLTKGGSTFLDRQYFFGTGNTPGQQCNPVANNTGNIWNVVDGLGGSYNQSLSYDSLNRLTAWTAPSMAGAYRHRDYYYDSFGNLLPAGVPASSATSYYTAGNRLPGSSFNCLGLNGETEGYDAAGNVLCGGTQNVDAKAYAWDAESRIQASWGEQNNNTYFRLGVYSYDADGKRVRSDQYAPGTNNVQSWREYSYANGQVLAEKYNTGIWTDYIYANGKKIAAKSSLNGQFFDTRIHLHGVNNSNGDPRGTSVPLPVAPYTIQPGDRLMWRQYQSGSARGGLFIAFAQGGSDNWNVPDGEGQAANDDTIQNVWHNRVIDLSAFAGLTLSDVAPINDVNSGNGTFDLYFADIAIVSANGAVFTRLADGLPRFLPCTPFFDTSEVSNAWAVVEQGTGLPQDDSRPRFYITDQVGTTALELTSAGWPLAKGEFDPFGQELDPALTTNRYKFTGKERDSESGLDNFGARYFGSTMGRFMSPDYSDISFGPDAVPNADYTNPQSLNLYAYGQNNPVKNLDPDGHDCIDTTNLQKNGTVSIIVGARCVDGLGPNGFYVSGTIDQHSLTTDGRGSLTYSFTSYDGQNSTTNVMTPSAPYGPLEGPANIAGAAMIGSGTKAIGVFAGASVAGGVLGAGGLAVAGTDLTLSSVSAAMRFRAAQAAWLALKGTGAAGLIGQFFKTGVIPPGLTTEMMQTYLSMAQAYVNSGIMPPGGVATQTARIAQLTNALAGR